LIDNFPVVIGYVDYHVFLLSILTLIVYKVKEIHLLSAQIWATSRERSKKKLNFAGLNA